MPATTSERLTITYTPTHPDTTGWKGRHLTAIARPHGSEKPIVAALSAWLQYADIHEQRYESRIGDDRVLGPAWAQIGDGIRQLLNGECGRLDCGTLDTIIADTLSAEGFNPDTL